MLDTSFIQILECMPSSLELYHISVNLNIFVAGCLIHVTEVNILISRGVLGLPLFLDKNSKVQND